MTHTDVRRASPLDARPDDEPRLEAATMVGERLGPVQVARLSTPNP
jgi:hypothetical protein